MGAKITFFFASVGKNMSNEIIQFIGNTKDGLSTNSTVDRATLYQFEPISTEELVSITNLLPKNISIHQSDSKEEFGNIALCCLKLSPFVGFCCSHIL